MDAWKELQLQRLRIPGRLLAVYVVIYFGAGLVMNAFGKMAQIAEFGHWWQVFTCYVLYLLPMSLLIRHRNVWDQYLYGLLVLAVLELLGYALGTSIAHPNNILDKILGERNFTLAMTVFFAVYVPGGNLLVAAVYRSLFGKLEAEDSTRLELAS